jgi:hypothetical protein
VDVPDELDFDSDWHGYVCGLERKAYILSGADVFCYRGDWMRSMPSFGMGRTAWDNWIMETAKRAGVPFVNGDAYTKAFHQEHPKHIARDQKRENRKLLQQAFSKVAVGTLRSATHELSRDGELIERNRK